MERTWGECHTCFVFVSTQSLLGSISAALSCPVYVRERSAGSFPEQRVVIEPKSPLVLYPRPVSLSDFQETNSAIQVVNAGGLVPGCIALNPPPSKSFPHKKTNKRPLDRRKSAVVFIHGTILKNSKSCWKAPPTKKLISLVIESWEEVKSFLVNWTLIEYSTTSI